MSLDRLADITNEDGSLTSEWGLGLSIGVGVLALIFLLLVLAALISILTRRRLTIGGKLLWLVVVVAFPFLGAFIWFLWGRNARLTNDLYRP